MLDKQIDNKMKKVLYNRVSTLDQKTDRQIKIDYFIVTDKISGSVPFFNRPNASTLKDMADLQELHVHSIDRLGRNSLDVLQTIQYFTERGVCVISEKEGLRTLNEDGSKNIMASLLIGILSTLAEFELTQIKERQLEGIAKAKEKGAFTGRKIGSKESTFKFLDKHPKVIAALKAGRSINSIANDKRLKVSAPTVVKIRKALMLVDINN